MRAGRAAGWPAWWAALASGGRLPSPNPGCGVAALEEQRTGTEAGAPEDKARRAGLFKQPASGKQVNSAGAPVVKRTSRRSPEPQVRVRLPAGALPKSQLIKAKIAAVPGLRIAKSALDEGC